MEIKQLAFQTGLTSFVICVLHDGDVLEATAYMNHEKELTKLQIEIIIRTFHYINNEFGCCGVEFDPAVTDGLIRCGLHLNRLM